jgi:ketosteroid isomerase-like protein
MKNTAVLILFFALVAIAHAQSPANRQKAESDILAVMDAQAAAWNRGDVEGFMRGYWNSPDLVFVSGANVTRGWKPTLERYQKNYDSKEKMGALKFSDVEITVLSKDSAVVLGSWSLARANDNPHGKFTLIFRRFKEGWRIVHDHTS